jgi:enoyl-CoA hydratase/carnithine racemase
VPIPSGFQTIRLSSHDDGRIVVLALDRPEVRNAISRRLAQELLDTCALLAAESSIRALVLTGSGERAFCAGADLAERRTFTAADRLDHLVAIEAAAEALAALPFPTIAAVRGYALAGGAELAIACDLRVAATDAVFGFPEVKIGIFPGAGGAHRLPRLIGDGAAKDLLFTGRQVAADEASRLRLVDRIAAPADTLDAALALARDIAANAPLAVRRVKQAVEQSHGLPVATARQVVKAHRVALEGTADYDEGLAAFAEKRSPRFEGR